MRAPWASLLPHCSAIVCEAGATGIRAAQVTGLGTRRRLRDSLTIRRPLTGDRPAAPDPAGTAERVARLIGQGRFIGREVGIVLSPATVHFHALRMPETLVDQPAAAIHEALAWEVAKELRAEAGDLEVRHWPLPGDHRQGLNFMAVALPRVTALNWVDEFAARGLTLRRLDVSPCTLLQAAVEAGQAPPAGLWVLIDLGMTATHVTVLLDRTPIYIRSITSRGDAWTREIAQAIDLEYAEAEALKRRHGVMQSDRASNSIETILARTLRDPIESLIHETILCCRYGAQSYVGRSVERVLLAGGGALLPGLAERMETALDIPVGPLRGFEGGKDELSSCIGGAVRDLEAA